MTQASSQREGLVRAAALFLLAFAVTVLLYSYSKFVTPAYASLSVNDAMCTPGSSEKAEVYFVGCGGFF
jgi:hypothetical protein